MSDPYNSYVAPDAAGALPPAVARPVAAPDPIARLPVSATWKRRFRLVVKAGGPELPKVFDLPFGERFALNFNVLAFLFGPIYYVIKGLWRQAVVYLVLAVAVVVLLEMLGLGRLGRGVTYGLAALYGLRANVSYYMARVLNAPPWF